MPDIISELIIAKVPLSAPDLAARLKCSVGEVLEEIHSSSWWTVLPVAGGWVGWKYQIRPVISTTKRMAKEIGLYNNQGISPTGPKGHVCDKA